MEAERLARLDLPQMVPNNDDAFRTAFTVSVDYRFGTTTGVSSSDRAATIRALADPNTLPKDFARPGHIFPLRPRKGGVLVRAGHTEAAVDLCRLAGLQPVGRAVRADERRRHDGAPPAARSLRAPAQPQDRHDRGSDPPSPAQRALDRARRPSRRCRPNSASSACTPTRIACITACISRSRTATSMARHRRSCAFTSPTRCAICSASAAT